MLAGTVLLEFQPGQLLDLLWRVKPSDIAYLREKSRCRDETRSLDGEQLLNVRYLPYPVHRGIQLLDDPVPACPPSALCHALATVTCP